MTTSPKGNEQAIHWKDLSYGSLDQIERDLRFYPSTTRHPKRLTPEEIASYNEKGYLTGLRVFDESDAIQNRQYFDKLLEQVLLFLQQTRIRVNLSLIASKVDVVRQLRFGFEIDVLTHYFHILGTFSRFPTILKSST